MSKKENALIKLTNAGVRKNRNWLVRGVTMSVHSGEIVTLIGPNGSGKTTTAKMALGLLGLNEGTTSRKNNLRIGYVPQKLQIDWTVPIKVKRFISLTKKISDKEIEFALSLTNTSHLSDKEIRVLSGGELQRVMVARAIALSPEFLVLDEPVQGVDYKGEDAIYNLIEGKLIPNNWTSVALAFKKQISESEDYKNSLSFLSSLEYWVVSSGDGNTKSIYNEIDNSPGTDRYEKFVYSFSLPFSFIFFFFCRFI